MNPTVTEWTVVAVGQWNPAIFSPEWVGTNVAHVDQLETELAVGPVGTAVRFQTPNLSIIPSPDRLIIGCRNVEQATLEAMESASRSTLHLLGHTPVRALGINFGFRENEPPPEMIRTFELRDTGALSDAGYNVLSTEILREFQLEQATLKLKMTLAQATIRFHFNFTHAVASAQEAAQLLDGRVIRYRDHALNMLTTVFDLQMEQVG